MYMQHSGGCAAMHCTSCHAHYCIWCRTVIGSLDKAKSADRNSHDHVFGCAKQPDKRNIITDSVLVPCNELDTDFVDCYLKTLKLRYLAQAMSANWSASDCKRLVLNTEFQEFLKHIKERQVSMLPIHLCVC